MSLFKIVIAGCGSMANTWIKYALNRNDCEIVALVDINIDNAVNMAKKYNIACPAYIDIATAIKETQANLVFDITIPESHKQIVTTALKMGCDVFGEKPLSSSMTDAIEMVKVVNETGRNYFVMQNRRYDKRARALRDIILSNKIGQVGFIGADFFLGPHFGGFRDIMESPLIMDMAIHTFDQARFFLNKDAVSVYCHEFNPTGSWYKGNAAAVCIFEMEDGSVFCYRGSWCSEGVPTSWESEWRVTGSKGTAIWDGINKPFYEVIKPSNEYKFMNDYERIVPEMTWQGNEGHEGCLDEMFSSLIAGQKAMTDCNDNIKSLAMVFAAIRSARQGEKVEIKYK